MRTSQGDGIDEVDGVHHCDAVVYPSWHDAVALKVTVGLAYQVVACTAEELRLAVARAAIVEVDWHTGAVGANC